MSDYDHVMKGTLKLKTESKIHKKGKKHRKKKNAQEEQQLTETPNVNAIEGQVQTSSDAPRLTKTKSEMEFDRRKEKRLLETVLTKAEKSHKQRIIELNDHLNTMSEHFDIPKVSWTK